MLKVVSDNQEPVEPAPDRFQIVYENPDKTVMTEVWEGTLSFSGPLLAIVTYDEETDEAEPRFATPYHRVVSIKKLPPEVFQRAN